MIGTKTANRWRVRILSGAACWMCALAVGALLAIAPLARAETAAEFPSRPLRWIVPYPAGGIPDRLARAFGEQLQAAWGHKVVIENLPGANSLIGNQAMFRAPADGYTLIQLTPVIAIGKVLYPGSGWPDSAFEMFEPVAQLLSTSNVIVVPAASPYGSLADLLRRTKGAASPELFGVPSIGSSVHLGMELFAEESGANLSAVGFKGGPDLATNLIGGHIGLASDNLANALPHLRAGKLRALMVMSRSRNPVIPDVPNAAESGFPGFESASWHGVAVRPGTPKPIVEKLSAELRRIAQMPEIRRAFEGLGDTVTVTTPQEFSELIRAESVRNSAIIQRRGIKGQ